MENKNIRRVKNNYSYSINGQEANKILTQLYSIDVPKLKRKWSKVKKYVRN
jgi:hypothetical protein